MSDVNSGAFTTPNQVRNVLVGTTLTDAQLEGCISTAMVVSVDRLQEAGLSDAAVSEIVLYLAAHFGALRDNSMRVKREELGEAKAEYSKTDNINYMDLNSTEWGATALVLDTSGTLRTLGKKQPRLISLDCNNE